MYDQDTSLRLLELLNLDEGAAGERLLRWAEAFQAWIAERQSRFSRNTGQVSYTAWREFLAFTLKSPWEATVADVEAYIAALEKRKLRPATIISRLASLSQFYKYCHLNKVDPACDAAFNPVAAARRPGSQRYHKANYLSKKEEAALLGAIRLDPSPMGRRDYALFLMLLRTGWKAREVRQLRWRELGSGEVGEQGEREKRAPPGEVWEALREYLEATGRWEGIQPEEYVFAPSRAPLVREAREQVQDWDRGRPLSDKQLLKLLKQHAGRAGLKAGKITTHTLRNTAAMRQVEAGASPQAVAAHLGFTRSRNVKPCLAELAQRPKGRMRARKRVDPDTGEVAVPGSTEIPVRGPHRAEPRNHLALTHGFYARYLPEFDWLAEQGVDLDMIDQVILRWRIVMRRIMIVGYDVDTLEDGLYYLKIIGRASARLVKAIKLKQKLSDLEIETMWEELFRQE